MFASHLQQNLHHQGFWVKVGEKINHVGRENVFGILEDEILQAGTDDGMLYNSTIGEKITVNVSFSVDTFYVEASISRFPLGIHIVYLEKFLKNERVLVEREVLLVRELRVAEKW